MKYPDRPKKGDKDYKLYRRLEMLPGLLTWATILGSIILSFLAPIMAVVFIIIYDVFWLTRVFIVTGHSLVAYRQMRKNEKIDWLKKAQKLGVCDGLSMENVYHLIVIPYYREGLEILEPAIKSIVDSNYPKDKIIISMSGEQRAGKEAYTRQKVLKKKYGGLFKKFLTNVHPVLPGEMKVKTNNANWAAKKGIEYLKTAKIPIDKVIVSNFDCDTCIHKQYLAKTSYHFIGEKERYRQSYQPLPTYNNNIWDTIAIVRIVALGASFWHLTESARPERLVTFSSHSMSLKALKEVGFWQSDVISDDSAIFWQCYIYYDGNYTVRPLLISVSMDATLAGSFWKTLVNQYKQKRRWAYGIESFPRIGVAFFRGTKISFFEKFRHMMLMIEGHYSWATSSLIILFLGWLPLIIGGNEFNETVVSHSLPLLTEALLTFGMSGILVAMVLSFYLVPKKPSGYKKIRYLGMLFQWLLVPFIAPIMGFPAIDSQTRLMLGRYFSSFWVSEKLRKSK
ncbi:MAG: hypothetical protein GF347_04295 [Candidatus Moranbacteria bacterium]|nr:hypothetical protein [Candidatus Moranbacteria bacterium]